MARAYLSVSQAAQRLGVNPQRVHHRIREGSLAAQKVGHQWVIDEADVRRVAGQSGSGRPGRPLSAKSAWDLLALAIGGDAEKSLDPVSRSRARTRLRNLIAHASQADLDHISAVLSHALRNRASRRLYVASPRDLDDLRDDKRVHLSGIAVPESQLAAGRSVEAYVSSDDLEALVEDYLLSAGHHDDANVILHVVPSEQAAHGPNLRAVVHSPLALAADLAEHEGVRERNEALRAVTEVRSLDLPDKKPGKPGTSGKSGVGRG
ncbi:MAG: hypothetical protein JWN84_1008 [Nocardioides sp.]|jgi:excisionase family DNA binding protein|nr:hypothetical protein [Nocardioides sp.]